MMFVIPAEHYRARYGGYILTKQFAVCVLFIITFLTAGVGGSTKKFAFGLATQLEISSALKHTLQRTLLHTT